MEYKLRKANRESRDRVGRMLARKRSTYPRMDRERRERVASYRPAKPWPERYGSEGLDCGICAHHVHGALNKQTAEARNAMEQVKNLEDWTILSSDNIASIDLGLAFLNSEKL